jgi:hypothetical protein
MNSTSKDMDSCSHCVMPETDDSGLILRCQRVKYILQKMLVYGDRPRSPATLMQIDSTVPPAWPYLSTIPSPL